MDFMAEAAGSGVAQRSTTNRLLAAFLYSLALTWKPLRRGLRKFGFKLSLGLQCSGWDVGRLGTEFVNQVIRVDQLRIQDAAERERKRDIAQRRADSQRRRNRRY